VSVDINGYYNIYNDFIGNLNVVAPYYGTAQDNRQLILVVWSKIWILVQTAAIQGGDFRVYQLYTNTDVNSITWFWSWSFKSVQRF
jgi:hypothetical protein